MMETAGARVEGLVGPPAGLEGLTTAEAESRLAELGRNVAVPEERKGGWLRVLRRSLTEPMSVLLLVAAATYLVLGDTVDAVAALAALVPIAGVSVVLERRAERALEELAALTAPTAVVWRDGRWIVVPTATVVPGDLVSVREGDIVCADGRLVDGERLAVDESALTGESLPVVKSVGEDTAVWTGTTVLSGRGVAEVVTTGPATRYGEIARLVATGRTRTPTEAMIRRLVLRLGVVAIVFAVLVGAVELARGGGWGAAVIAGVSLGIAAIPEEFPLVFTIYLALGARRLARRRALVRTLTGVETLGSTTVICADKTGTLTAGRLTVAAVSPVVSAGEADVLAAAVLASEPAPFDPLDVAVVAAAAEAGVDVAALHSGDLVADYEFDPAGKHVTHVWRTDGVVRVAAKGSLEGILSVAAADEAAAGRATAAMSELGAAGMRVVGVAGGELGTLPDTRAEAERGLRLLGLVAFADPVRPEVPAAIAACRTAGIRVVVITGDHPATARTVAAELGLAGAGATVTGDDIDAADDTALGELAATASVFARIRPDQKHRIVRALRLRGEVVAMTGDGINDAPSLREADIGVAMGERGTAVAREAATLVLLDDNFATIVEAVREGRRIFANLQNAFGYLVAFHVPLLLLALLVPLLGEELLLLPFTLIALEFLLHPLVALVFENDPPPEGVMDRPPRPRGVGLIGRRLLLPAVRGLTLTAATLGLYLALLDEGTLTARGTALACLFLGELALVVTERTGRGGNRILLPLLAGGAAVVAALFLVPGLREVMGVAALTGRQWGIALAAAAVATLWGEPFRRRPGT